MAAKPKKTRYNYLSADVNYQEYILREKKHTFKRQQTGYSVKFETETEILWITPSRGGIRLYGAFSKLKSYLLRFAPEIDFVPRSSIRYFDLNKNLRELSVKNAYCVDIKSAYLTALLNCQVINSEIYEYINKLPKLDRLRCLGMLATQKVIFEFTEGKATNYEIKRSDKTAKYFFLACYEIGQIMERVRREIGEDFIFYWVDGIFCRNKRSAKKAERILSEANYNFTTEKLDFLRVEHTDPQYWQIILSKGGEIKPFNIPVLDYRINPVYLDAN